MTAPVRPTPRQVRNAMRVLAAAWGDSWAVDALVPAHVEWVTSLGGPVDTFRAYAVNGNRNVLLAQVPRAALEKKKEGAA